MCHNLTHLPFSPPTANSQPGSGPGALAGLPATIGVNGFGPLTPQTNGQPGSDSLYNNGLSPYPGGPPHPTLSKSPFNGVRSREWGVRALLWGMDSHYPCCLSQQPTTSHTPRVSLLTLPTGLHRGPCAPLSPAQSPGVADPLQQAYAGMHHYAGFTWRFAAWGGFEGPQKEIGRFVGRFSVCSEESTLLSNSPQIPTTSLGTRFMVDWVELIKNGLGPVWGMAPGDHCPLPPLSPAAYPSAYAPVSTAFPQQPSALPQQQREGEGLGAGVQSLVGLDSRPLP